MRPGARFCGTQKYDPFFYPLDGIEKWNRLYGSRGFYQHQCIVPKLHAKEAMQELLNTINTSGEGSFLAVMKAHGLLKKSPGRNSFCLEGTSLALDFPNKGEKTRDLLRRLEQIVIQYQGRIYPAKDSLMTAENLPAELPQLASVRSGKRPQTQFSILATGYEVIWPAYKKTIRYWCLAVLRPSGFVLQDSD